MDEPTVGNSEFGELIWNVEQTGASSLTMDSDVMLHELYVL